MHQNQKEWPVILWNKVGQVQGTWLLASDRVPLGRWGDSGASKLRLDGGSKAQPPRRKAPVLDHAPFRLKVANEPYFQKGVLPLSTCNLRSPEWPEVVPTKGLSWNDSTVQVASLSSLMLEMWMTNYSKNILRNMGLRSLWTVWLKKKKKSPEMEFMEEIVEFQLPGTCSSI